jgi:hypothetical protein
MDDRSYTFRFTVDRGPEEVWAAVCNVRGWWSQEIEGPTDRRGAEFDYHYRDVHRCSFRITEFVPGRKAVWHVVSNEFNFTKDRTEWVGTDVVFELTPRGSGTELVFTHRGLVPAYECFEICRDAWGGYLGGSLKDLVLTGRGQPNPIEAVVDRAQVQSTEDFQVRVRIPVAPGTVMAAVDRPTDWWSADIQGSVARIGDEFVFRHQDLHRSAHRVTEKIPGRRAVWAVTESQLSFVKKQDEWTGTELTFEAFPQDGGTELVFTHVGLNRQMECFGDCAAAWTYYLQESLFALVTTGNGKPEPTSRSAS